MRRAIITIGLGFGDEGKGTLRLLEIGVAMRIAIEGVLVSVVFDPGNRGVQFLRAVAEVSKATVAIVAEQAADTFGTSLANSVRAALVIVVDTPTLLARIGCPADTALLRLGVVPFDAQPHFLEHLRQAATSHRQWIFPVIRFRFFETPLPPSLSFAWFAFRAYRFAVWFALSGVLSVAQSAFFQCGSRIVGIPLSGRVTVRVDSVPTPAIFLPFQSP